MPKAVLSQDAQGRTEYHRDAHDETGRVVIKRVDYDDHILDSNKRHRLNQSLQTGANFDIHDGAEVIYHFQIPPRAWGRFKRKHPDLYRSLHSTDQITRERAVANVAVMHPEWVIARPGPAPRY